MEQLAAIVDAFPKRLKARIAAKGGHFENRPPPVAIGSKFGLLASFWYIMLFFVHVKE